MNKARKSWKLSEVAQCRETIPSARVRLCGLKTPAADSPGSLDRAAFKGATAHEGARSERLAALKTAIAQGRYHVSAADLSQKIIDHMLAPQSTKIIPPTVLPPNN